MRRRVIPVGFPPAHDQPRHRDLRLCHAADSRRGRRPDARPLGSPLPPDRGRALSRPGPERPPIRESWLFTPGIRYCPSCLSGDDSPVQEQYGGPWRKYWLLPIAFACPLHRVLLMDDCPKEHSPTEQGHGQLIRHAADSTLHPAQCRRPVRAGYRGPGGRACGGRLDIEGTGGSGPAPAGPDILDAQQRLLSILDGLHPAEAPASTFTDITVITALLCDSWPLGRDLMNPLTAAAAGSHISRLNASPYRALLRPPGDVLATAGLITAAVMIMDSPDLAGTVAQLARTRRTGTPSRSSWARIIDRYRPECSAALLDAAEPATRVYRKTAGPHSRKAPSRPVGYRPQHIPALLPRNWYDEHLAPLGYKMAKSMRRAGAIILVQWAAGGSVGDAAIYLGIRARDSGSPYAPDLARWLRDHGTDDFTEALRHLAAHLDSAPGLIDYQRRRQAMRAWCLDPDTWQQLTLRLPPARGRFQPILDDRSRQEASAFTWAYVTQGEPRSAPHPIQDTQPRAAQKNWFKHRGSAWSLFADPGRFVHYAELRKLLIEHGDRLAKDIDYSG